ncbi:hypothetical protein E4U42_000556 [Claviceps africana]|uniref:Uncharacterized protein n=1 Tax=Claviceps africana TaxID=83212 RepID=A0A8K0NIE0_9HYPO|nr:hypothetical protein E4U42_000556 [Claviceps africana]
MGNICGKEDPDPPLPTRIPSSVTPSHGKVSVPHASRKHKVGGPARTLGGPDGSAPPVSPADAAADARRKAAAAAEARAKANKPGKLQAKLDAQKRQPRNETLKAASEQERRTREIAQTEDARAYN